VKNPTDNADQTGSSSTLDKKALLQLVEQQRQKIIAKHKEIDEKNDFLFLSTWGAGAGSYSRSMYVHKDGSFIIKIRTYTPYPRYVTPTNVKLISNTTTNVELIGTKDMAIAKSRIDPIIELLKHRVVKDERNEINDAGYEIWYNNGSTTIKIVNNRELFNELVELIPEYKAEPVGKT